MSVAYRFLWPREWWLLCSAYQGSKVNSCYSNASHQSTQAIQRLQAANGRAKVINWNTFEQDKEIVRDLSF